LTASTISSLIPPIFILKVLHHSAHVDCPSVGQVLRTTTQSPTRDSISGHTFLYFEFLAYNPRLASASDPSKICCFSVTSRVSTSKSSYIPLQGLCYNGFTPRIIQRRARSHPWRLLRWSICCCQLA
jgi:hypothetical protein